MSETNWTPEPWYENGVWIVSNQGSMDERVNIYDANPANRNRIVACVNACAGIPDPAAEIERLRRVEVAAKSVLNCWHRYDPNAPPDAFSNRLDELLAAIKEPANG